MISPSFATCPTCGQRMLIRHGVRLSPMYADVYDMVERSGDRGVKGEVLGGVFYPDAPHTTQLNRIRSIVYHINIKLAETDYEVRAASNQPYRVRRTRR
jgi:hypothetical protein